MHSSKQKYLKLALPQYQPGGGTTVPIHEEVGGADGSDSLGKGNRGNPTPVRCRTGTGNQRG